MEGKFQLTVGDDDNMDKILEATGKTWTIPTKCIFVTLVRFGSGYGADVRAISRTVKPIVGFAKNGDAYVLTMSGAGKEISVNVTMGQEVTHTAPDGRTAKVISSFRWFNRNEWKTFYLMFQSVFTREAGVGLIQMETIDGKTTKYVRNVAGDDLHVVSWHSKFHF